MKKISLLKLIFWYWLPVFVWMAIIFYFSSRQRVSVSETYTVNFILFKSLHVIEYAALFFLVFRAYYRSFTGFKLNTVFIMAICTAILYGASDEIHQIFVPTREGSPRDVLIDTIGIMIMFSYTKKYLSKLRLLL